MVTRETFDDVFDEDADEDIIHHREWNKIETDLKKDGFRDGLDTGQEATLQIGFNEGYKQAVSVCEKFGCLRGRLSAQLSMKQLREDTTEANGESRTADIESLIKQISNYEKHLITIVKKQSVTPIRNMNSTKTTSGTESGGSGFKEGNETDCDSRAINCGSGACQDGSGYCQASDDQGEVTLNDSKEKVGFEQMFSRVLSDAKTEYEKFAARVENLI